LPVAAAAGLAALLAAPLFAQAQAPKIRLVTREVSLGKVHPGALPDTLAVSPDSRRVAYLAVRGGKWLVVVDGAEGNEYDAFLRGTKLVFDSPTALHGPAYRAGEFFRVEVEIIEE
jgi:hypothetical protein